LEANTPEELSLSQFIPASAIHRMHTALSVDAMNSTR
jgi:hypothetical protein